jgi:hypothetical protein
VEPKISSGYLIRVIFWPLRRVHRSRITELCLYFTRKVLIAFYYRSKCHKTHTENIGIDSRRSFSFNTADERNGLLSRDRIASALKLYRRASYTKRPATLDIANKHVHWEVLSFERATYQRRHKDVVLDRLL